MAQSTHRHDHNHENVEYGNILFPPVVPLLHPLPPLLVQAARQLTLHLLCSYGEMYAQPWVQATVSQIQSFLISNATWLGIGPGKEQRVLDYACGHGTISLGVMQANSDASCQGIDLDASQVGRYNSEARKAGVEGRMKAIHGDLYEPTAEMVRPEWNGFDVAVISMALHHVRDPVEMLRRLKERLRPGGTVVVVEFLGKEKDAPCGKERHEESAMVETGNRQGIWPGFTTGHLEADLESAGFEGFEVRVLDEPAHIPESVRGEAFGGEQWCFFAKAVRKEA